MLEKNEKIIDNRILKERNRLNKKEANQKKHSQEAGAGVFKNNWSKNRAPEIKTASGQVVRVDGKTQYTYDTEGKAMMISNPRVDKLPSFAAPQPQFGYGTTVVEKNPSPPPSVRSLEDPPVAKRATGFYERIEVDSPASPRRRKAGLEKSKVESSA